MRVEQEDRHLGVVGEGHSRFTFLLATLFKPHSLDAIPFEGSRTCLQRLLPRRDCKVVTQISRGREQPMAIDSQTAANEDVNNHLFTAIDSRDNQKLRTNNLAPRVVVLEQPHMLNDSV